MVYGYHLREHDNGTTTIIRESNTEKFGKHTYVTFYGENDKNRFLFYGVCNGIYSDRQFILRYKKKDKYTYH